MQRILHVVGRVLVFDRRSLVRLGNGVGRIDWLAIRGRVLLVRKRRSGEFPRKAICIEGILLGLWVRPGHWELVNEELVDHEDISENVSHRLRITG